MKEGPVGTVHPTTRAEGQTKFHKTAWTSV
jgi:hypothetical protein